MEKVKKIASLVFTLLLVMTTVAIPVAMAEVNTGTNTETGIGCSSCGSSGCKPQKSVEKEVKDKIVNSISKEISIPKDYDLIAAPNSSGFALIYNTSSTSKTIVEISPSYEVTEIWTSTISEIQSGRNIILTSNKGKELSITYATDPSSNKGKVTVYNSSTGEVTTLSLCYDVCMGLCNPLVGTSCNVACYGICIGMPIPYWACIANCQYQCGSGTLNNCNGICTYICNN